MTFTTTLKIAQCHHKERYGNLNDGGYVVCSNDLCNSDFLLSFGLGDNWTFESDFLLKNSEASVHVYDFSVNFRSLLFKGFKAFPSLFLGKINRLEFMRRIQLPFKYWFFFSGKNIHFKKKVSTYKLSNSESTIDEIFSLTSSKKIFLKVDIEGSEYGVLEDILSYSDRIIGIVLEFHNIEKNQIQFLKMLDYLSGSFEILHAHGNNYEPMILEMELPNVLELSLTKRKSHKESVSKLEIPHKVLDSPNNSNEVDFWFEIVSNFPD